MRFIRVKNFERFQHYKDRSPTWIKLYNALLDDYAFACLQDASKLHLIMIWLLASRYDNRIPADPQWIGRRVNATDTVDIGALVSSGFLEEYDSDSDVLADVYGPAIPETETETEKEKEPPNPLKGEPPAAKPGSPHVRNADPPGFERFWKEWPTHRRKVDRAGCSRRWKRGELEPVAEQVIGGLRRWKASQDWKKDGGNFIPAPLVWLNQERWKVPGAAFAEQASDGNGFVRVEHTDAELNAMLLEGQ